MDHKRLEDPDLTLDDLMTAWPETIHVFVRYRMLCVGCLVSPFHTVTDACDAYGLTVDAFCAELRAALSPALPPE